jgi:hypothetical protein
MSGLAKEHGDELAPASDTSGVSFGSVLTHGRFKFQAGDQFQNL